MSAQAIHLLLIQRCCSYLLVGSLRPTYLACLLCEWLRLFNQILKWGLSLLLLSGEFILSLFGLGVVTVSDLIRIDVSGALT